MKVFCVITERDGDTTKSPGRTETDIHRVERRFAAETLERVWEEAKLLPVDDTIVAIYEERPSIVFLHEREQWTTHQHIDYLTTSSA